MEFFALIILFLPLAFIYLLYRFIKWVSTPFFVKDSEEHYQVSGEETVISEEEIEPENNLEGKKYKKQVLAEQKRLKRESIVEEKEFKRQLAGQKTKEAQKKLEEIENILQYSFYVNNVIDWDSLLDRTEYTKTKSSKPLISTIPIEPKRWDLKYRIEINRFINFLFPEVEKKKIKEADLLFEQDRLKWQKEKPKVEEKNRKLLEEHERDLRNWEKEKELFIKKRDKKNKKILEKQEKYFKKDTDAIIDYCELVLSNSKYPDVFPQQYDFDYNLESKVLLLDFFLPSKENTPTLKEVKYNISQDEFKEIHISESALNKLYDNLLYQITLRTIHELYEADTIKSIASIVFNGFVRFVDKGTGQEVTACILSIQAQREEFLEINLKGVDPKECFKKLKGVGSSKLHGLAPVAPIMKIDRKDKRFVSPYDVVDSVDETTNIAAMHWKDFENLIRELFEKEFSAVGGEVKITRASRDEGVDAIAFDPDPIRGGKIVIQAKRYTNIVGVSAVRDLYGTVVNEGATKGILVTTTDYGPDAYKFAQDKPLTLLNGSNLLHLLEKYGHKAKIDIKEAKKILTEEQK